MARILVIDDDNDIAALVGLKLELDGHAVADRDRRPQGLARAQQDRPDVLIVDWTLPGLTGPEICAQMRADPALDSMWVIMLTARPLGRDGAGPDRRRRGAGQAVQPAQPVGAGVGRADR